MEEPDGYQAVDMDVDDEDLIKFLLQTAETQDPTVLQKPSPCRVPSPSMNASPQKSIPQRVPSSPGMNTSPQKSSPHRVPSSGMNASPQKPNPGKSPQKSLEEFFRQNPDQEAATPKKVLEPSLETPPKPTAALGTDSVVLAKGKAGKSVGLSLDWQGVLRIETSWGCARSDKGNSDGVLRGSIARRTCVPGGVPF